MYIIRLKELYKKLNLFFLKLNFSEFLWIKQQNKLFIKIKVFIRILNFN
jgi:hypothetical protein